MNFNFSVHFTLPTSKAATSSKKLNKFCEISQSKFPAKMQTTYEAVPQEQSDNNNAAGVAWTAAGAAGGAEPPTQPKRAPKPAQKNRRRQQQQQQQQKASMMAPMPGLANQWVPLSNSVHEQGTSIEMMYAGFELPQQEEGGMAAIPGVTHMTMQLPPNVLPTVRNSTPDMPSVLHAMDYFRHQQHMQQLPGIGSSRVQLLQNDPSQQSCNSEAQVMPLGCVPAIPLERHAMSLAFQSYSLMQLEPDPSRAPQLPGQCIYNANISPLYALTQEQQLKLQAALIQKPLSLDAALLPIAEELHAEHEQLRSAGLQLLPQAEPLPYGSISFHEGEQPATATTNAWASPPPPTLSTPIPHMSLLPLPTRQWRQKRRNGLAQQFENTINVNDTIMMLDESDNYQPMVFMDWWINFRQNRSNKPKKPLLSTPPQPPNEQSPTPPPPPPPPTSDPQLPINVAHN
ncbi:uncharacterized protein LOC108605833 [Drosophila busckii]|uniref:uncharacterized protein LOC108605833 n=1 Tax=Drosophila busckii TaxID=30019 RepID=UPI00083F2D74|nr:uncharacterized protein LOC108605833 [Drosophila busckii]